MRILIALAATALIAAPALAGPTAPAATLSVTFTGIETPQGKVLVSVFDGGAAWQAGKPVRVAMVDVKGGEATAAFEGLAPGDYAVKSFHDLDGDGKLSTNPFGMPTEPFAFSNDARGAMGPASWEAASFQVVAGANAQRITIR
jgi:uncharacterized protein (DUF2141 family)